MTGAYVVVGVTPGQPEAVVRAAARFALRFDAEVVCAHVLTGNYAVSEDPDGNVHSLPIDADARDWSEGLFDQGLLGRLPEILDPLGVRWSTRTLAGEPARALSHLADKLNAAMIVLGTRRTDGRRTFREFFATSVAVHLAHRQHRPVVVVPLDPVGFE